MITVIFNVSNQPSVKVDISLLDEVKKHKIGGSYASQLSPPKCPDKKDVGQKNPLIQRVFRIFTGKK